MRVNCRKCDISVKFVKNCRKCDIKCCISCNLRTFLPNRKYRKYRVIIVSKPKISCNIVWTLKKDIVKGWSGKQVPLKFPCILCPKVFTSEYYLRKHKQDHEVPGSAKGGKTGEINPAPSTSKEGRETTAARGTKRGRGGRGSGRGMKRGKRGFIGWYLRW